MKALASLILLVSSLSAFGAGSAHDTIRMNISRENAKIVFSNLSTDTESISGISLGAGIYARRVLRSGNAIICQKLELDINDENNERFSCYRVTRASEEQRDDLNDGLVSEI